MIICHSSWCSYFIVINVWTSTRTVDALKSKSQAAKKLSGSTQSLEVVSNIKHCGKQQIPPGYEGRYIPASEVKAEQQSHLVGRRPMFRCACRACIGTWLWVYVHILVLCCTACVFFLFLFTWTSRAPSMRPTPITPRYLKVIRFRWHEAWA